MGFLRRHSLRLLLILALAGLGGAVWHWVVPAEARAVVEQLVGFPDSDVQAHQARPLVLGALGFLPLLAFLVYLTGDTLDRYLTRQFLGIFIICLLALLMIFLLIDVSGKITDFREAENFWVTVGIFYAVRLPSILLLLLPYSLLLALLHALGKLSTHREIIAILQSGRGLMRLALPLLVAGGFCTLLSAGLSYHWAPIAEGRLNDILAEVHNRPATEASEVLYRNLADRRLWMIGAFPANYEKGEALLSVAVTTTDANHKLQSRLFASSAVWNRQNHHWTFANPTVGTYQPGQPPTFVSSETPLVIDSWSETPWQLIKPGISATYLGIPDLNGWLRANSLHEPFADPSPYLTQWHYRWALPFTCLVTVLLATPLAIHFSRRGAGGGIFFAVVLSALMLLVSNIVLALGEAGILQPALAAWLPNLAFALLGIDLFRRRVTGRPIYQVLGRFLPGGA